MSQIPDGFHLVPTSSPFINLVGPLYCEQRGDELVFGLLLETRHCNSSGRLHGGMVNTMADIALGHNIGSELVRNGGQPTDHSNSDGARFPMATVSMSTDFVGTAREGEWVEIYVDVQHAGKSLAFANAYLVANNKRIARVSAVFKVSL